MSDFEIIESPFMQIIADLAKNNKNLTPELQNAIARFLAYETTPKITMTAPKPINNKANEENEYDRIHW